MKEQSISAEVRTIVGGRFVVIVKERFLEPPTQFKTGGWQETESQYGSVSYTSAAAARDAGAAYLDLCAASKPPNDTSSPTRRAPKEL